MLCLMDADPNGGAVYAVGTFARQQNTALTAIAAPATPNTQGAEAIGSSKPASNGPRPAPISRHTALDANSSAQAQLLSEVEAHKAKMQALGIDTEQTRLDPAWLEQLRG